MKTEAFNEMQWVRGMSVLYKVKNEDSPTTENIRRTDVTGVEFQKDGGGIYGEDIEDRRIFVHHSQIIDVRWNFKH